MSGIQDDAFDRTHLDALWSVVVTNAFGAKMRSDFVDFCAERDRLIRTNRIADVTVDAQFGNL